MIKIALKKAVDGLFSDFVLKCLKKRLNFRGCFLRPKNQKNSVKIGFLLS